ncbi:hypothetical protein JXZ92_00235 [Mycoplasma sp. CSL10137]|uniref:MSC_0621 family F1-like ATPase epsilon subunit n=1 Tax=unclassified Mycoplasma TaxID=2683645 RepID=UPI00197C5E62|nr:MULTISPECIES: hypothetical protein [unclassified Mycoplasma]MBN4083250.1 hypothetical protein [Mycoplasma sp. CSL10137]MBN4084453.1 hypothetical protein [Mycoplasma sp. CSL10166]MBU4692933.1 hypothetical protein [Mycoplasma sp. CSL7491-lung]
MNFKTIHISFIDNKHLTLKGYFLSINHNDEDDWIKLEKNSISAYPQILVKFTSEKENEFYLFLKNANIVIEEDETIIKTFSSMKFYKRSKNKQNHKEKINTLNERINYLKFKQNIGLTIDETIKLDELREDLYEYKLMQQLKIKERDDYE